MKTTPAICKACAKPMPVIDGAISIIAGMPALRVCTKCINIIIKAP